MSESGGLDFQSKPNIHPMFEINVTFELFLNRGVSSRLNTKTITCLIPIILPTSWATRLCSGFLFSALSLCLFISMSLYLSQTLSNLKYSFLLTCPPTCPSLSLSPPPSLFPDKKFPVVEALFWLNKLFYYIDYIVNTIQSGKQTTLKPLGF
jgi:hypothetical protein